MGLREATCDECGCTDAECETVHAYGCCCEHSLQRRTEMILRVHSEPWREFDWRYEMSRTLCSAIAIIVRYTNGAALYETFIDIVDLPRLPKKLAASKIPIAKLVRIRGVATE